MIASHMLVLEKLLRSIATRMRARWGISHPGRQLLARNFVAATTCLFYIGDRTTDEHGIVGEEPQCCAAATEDGNHTSRWTCNVSSYAYLKFD